MSLFSAIVALSLLAVHVTAAPAGQPASGYVPQRVYDTQKKTFVDFEVMLADLTTADVVFVGEQHDDRNTHRLELAILEGLKRRNVAPIVSVEMFERDVQPQIDAYLGGATSEEEMLKASRPWPRYPTDHRPLVEFAKAERWPVIAANVPRRIAAAVAKTGKDAIEQLSPEDRTFAARELQCPLDGYFERFAQSMGDHPARAQNAEAQRAMTERYYWSQCLKDETMADAIAAAVQRRKAPGVIVHYNGAFHSDFGLGTAERTRRRLPGKRIVVISMLPVENLDALDPSGEDLLRADFLVFTQK